MGLERLAQKTKTLRKGLFAGTTLIGSLYLGGCAPTLSEGEGLTLVGAVMRESDDALLRRLSPYASLLGAMRLPKEYAREGRTQINIQREQPQTTPENVNYQNGRYTPNEGYVWVDPDDPDDLSIKKKEGSAFAFRWVDYDRSGDLDILEDELIGRRSRFEQNENLALMLLYCSEEPFQQNLKIYGPTGRLVFEKDEDPLRKKRTITMYVEGGTVTGAVEGRDYREQECGIKLELGADRPNIGSFLQWFGEGEYSAVWRVNGRVMDSITFDMIY